MPPGQTNPTPRPGKLYLLKKAGLFRSRPTEPPAKTSRWLEALVLLAALLLLAAMVLLLVSNLHHH